MMHLGICFLAFPIRQVSIISLKEHHRCMQGQGFLQLFCDKLFHPSASLFLFYHILLLYFTAPYIRAAEQPIFQGYFWPHEWLSEFSIYLLSVVSLIAAN